MKNPKLSGNTSPAAAAVGPFSNAGRPRSSKVILFHKPYGVVTQFTGGPGERTLADYINIRGVYAAGRLDKDSEGLLLLTDDGGLQHRLSHPKFEKSKTYWVQVEGIPTDAALAELRHGVQIQEYRTKPAEVRLIEDPNAAPRDSPIRYRKDIPTSWLEMMITEGKNRQVRRMTAAVGFPTLRLIRVAIGGLRIDGLSPGEWRMLTQAEVVKLQVSARSLT